MPSEFPVASDSTVKVGLVGYIPVRNLWLLMLYASNLFRDKEFLKNRVQVEENPEEIADLVAQILCHRVEYRIRSNLRYGYQQKKENLHRVRGRIDILQTEAHKLLERGQIACRYEEFTINTVRNRYVRAALAKMAKLVQNQNLKQKCSSLASALCRMGVVGKCPNPHEISIERFGRHDAEDQPMVTAAHLAFNLALPTEETGRRLLAAPEKNLAWARKLFEKGIAGFYDVVLPKDTWRVKAGRFLHWQIQDKTDGIDAILQDMESDIILEHKNKNQRIIIDTKFNSILAKGWYRDKAIRNGYLYQIYAYLMSQEKASDVMSKTASGMLLHPAVGYGLNEVVTIQNHKIQFVTVDLSQDAKAIRKQLLDILEVHM